MLKEISGDLKADGKRFGIVLSRFNDLIGGKLLEGALDCLRRHGADDKNLTVVRVPGAFEIPLTALRLAETGSYDAIITLGAVIRGSTPHFEYVASETSKGVASAAMKTGVPVIFGVLTTDTIEQAIERAGTKAGNKGWDAALGAMKMANLFDSIPKTRETRREGNAYSRGTIQAYTSPTRFRMSK